MAMPASSAASMTSSSRTELTRLIYIGGRPGWYRKQAANAFFTIFRL